MPPKLVTVYGATGIQGGSVIKSLLQNKQHAFKIRAITRNPDSEAARQLAAQGVEVVRANGFEKDQMISAFEGSWGAFVNTASDDPALDGEVSEVDLGRIIINAAAEAGVQHFIYSGMASSTTASKGKVTSQAFDDKYAIGALALSLPAFSTVSIVSLGWYMSNFMLEDLAPLFGGFPYVPDEEGYLTFKAPKWGGKEDVPFISVPDDLGDIVHGIFLDPESWDRKFVQAVSDPRSFNDVTDAFAEASGKRSRFVPLETWTDLEVHGIKALETVKTMFGFCQESGGRYYGVETENKTAAGLKKAASQAMGKHGVDAELMTLERYFSSVVEATVRN